MPTMIFLSEYVENNRTAHLFKRERELDYVVMCYTGSSEKEHGPFALESEAEDYAEDFVKGIVEPEEQPPVSDSTSCCDK